MLRGEHNTALNASLRQAGEHSGEVDDKLRCRVCDKCYIAVVALRYLLVELDLKTLRFLYFVHSFNIFLVTTLQIFGKDTKNMRYCKIRAWQVVAFRSFLAILNNIQNLGRNIAVFC